MEPGAGTKNQRWMQETSRNQKSGVEVGIKSQAGIRMESAGNPEESELARTAGKSWGEWLCRLVSEDEPVGEGCRWVVRKRGEVGSLRSGGR